jgi:hypothetical protein
MLTRKKWYEEKWKIVSILGAADVYSPSRDRAMSLPKFK